MLRILVVDDNTDKLRRILQCIESVPGCSPEQVDSAHNANEAKRLLRDRQYDLMILDIALPDRSEDFPSPDGGIRLLEEVLERDVYLKPREVVGLTAFHEILESAGRRFAEDLWLVVHYDPTVNTWAEQLGRKVRHILLAKRSQTVPEFHAYLCVVTALLKPELSAVLDIPWGWQKHEIPNDPTIYRRGAFAKGGTQCEVIAASAERMGMTSAAVLAVKMISTFRPRYLAIAGMLAGIRGRCSPGDVTAADPCWDWGSGKYHIKDGTRQFAPAPYQIGLNSFIRSKLALLSASQDVLDEIRNGWRGSTVDHILRMRIGPVASGAAVLADPEVAASVIEQHRKLLGIEMESYGVLLAAEESSLPVPKAFSLKAVSDFGEADKNDDHQRYACYTSATTLRVFVERFL